VQIAFIVAFGVLLDTLVVRSPAGARAGDRHRAPGLVAEHPGPPDPARAGAGTPSG
jgi:hypothetical protein